MSQDASRLEAEWVGLTAFRGLLKVASRSDMLKSTYDNALDFGAALYPELLGPEHSMLWRERESDTTREYRQRAQLLSVRESRKVDPLALVQSEIHEIKGLLRIAEETKASRSRVDQLRRKLKQLVGAEEELQPTPHSEHQLIFKDAYHAENYLPARRFGRGYRDFELPEDRVLRVRVLHPDIPEQVTGADLIYERHDPKLRKASMVAVQYKIWEDRTLYLSDPRMATQLERLSRFLCKRGLCSQGTDADGFRFPHCSAFIRPTDKLQNAGHKFFSTGEHLPICRIQQCKGLGARSAEVLTYDRIKDVSVTGDMFEYLFNRGKLGSRLLDYDELDTFYQDHSLDFGESTLLIYAQEK